MQTAHELILSHAKLTGNTRIAGYAQLREAFDLSWPMLFRKTPESIVRKWFDVDNGKLDMPCYIERLLDVFTENDCGDLKSLYEDNHRNTLPKPSLKCTCTSCDADECMCPTIQVIPIQEQVLVNGDYYTNKTYTKVLKNGEVITYKEEWATSYNKDGDVEGVILIPTQVTRCNVAVKSCGCVENNSENVALLFSCGCIVDYCAPYLREKYPAIYNPYGYYKNDNQTKKLHIFDRKGRKSKLKQIMLVYQSNGTDMIIPDYARPALLALLTWTVRQYSPLYNDHDRDSARRYFSRMKNEMLRFIHPIPFESIVQSGDYNAMIIGNRMRSYNNQILGDMNYNNSCQPAPLPCPVPNNTPVTNIINHTTVVNQGGTLTYNFDVAEDGWQEAIITDLIGKSVERIFVDGIKRKFTTVSESIVTPPPDGSFYWAISTGRLQYRVSLNQDAWVSIDYIN